jgi:hypothetical protein
LHAEDIGQRLSAKESCQLDRRRHARPHDRDFQAVPRLVPRPDPLLETTIGETISVERYDLVSWPQARIRRRAPGHHISD